MDYWLRSNALARTLGTLGWGWVIHHIIRPSAYQKRVLFLPGIGVDFKARIDSDRKRFDRECAKL